MVISIVPKIVNLINYKHLKRQNLLNISRTADHVLLPANVFKHFSATS